MTTHPVHIDERQALAALDQLEAYQRPNEHKNDAAGVQARLQLAALRPVYLALVREINAGATNGDLQKAFAGFISNLVLSIADSATDKWEPARTEAINQMMIEIGFCIRKGLQSDGPSGSSHRIKGMQGGRA